MKNSRNIFLIAMVAVSFSCNLLKPEPENNSDFSRVLSEPSWADGLLLNGYSALPYNSNNPFRWEEVATDDAVSNLPTNNYRRMATGSWSASNNPEDLWSSCNRGIQYVNQFLSIVDDMTFRSDNPLRNSLFQKRLKGEAYALRGALKYYLLRNHGGEATDGRLLGTPIYNEFLGLDSDLSKPRDTFEDCVNSAYSDFEEALKLLPLDYGNIDAVVDIPNNYSELKTGYSEVMAKEEYNTVCGNTQRQRISGRITMAFRMRLALLQASPAFNLNNNKALWEKTAEYASELLEGKTLDPKGHIYFLKAQVDECNLSDNKDLSEHLWRRVRRNTSNNELEFFPPSMNGSGRINPTQNFVDAFPMANGYPISNSASGYNRQNPYENRDPRFGQAVIYNECVFNKTIYTFARSGLDAINSSQTATRTGYYLRKHLRDDVSVGTITTPQFHIEPFIRYTEVFLTYAEAANEAYGPAGDPKGKGYSAVSIIKDIRQRAGIDENDPYLASISDEKTMRELIHNERRIELSFEGFRFWDLRRWKAKLDEPVSGDRIELGSGHNYFQVEPREYSDYMIYGPIPYSEIVKFKFIQNKGW